jgi:hypothetical protein
VSSTRRLAEIAAGQWGLVTTAQAGALGVSSQSVAKLAGNGSLERLGHGVYRVAGVPMDPLDELRAAWLGLEPARTAGDRLADEIPDVVSDRSAAVLFGFGDVEADVHEFTVAARRQTRRDDVRFHRRKLGSRDWTLHAGLPATTPAVTIRDLAASNLDVDHLAAVVRDVLLASAAEPDVVAEVLRPFADAYGAAGDDGADLLRRLLMTARIPAGLTRVVDLACGRRTAPGRRAG